MNMIEVKFMETRLGDNIVMSGIIAILGRPIIGCQR